MKIFLSPTRPHKSNVYEKMFFVSKKHAQNKFPLANLFARIYVFSLQKIKNRTLCFSPKKQPQEFFYKKKLFLKNS